MRLGETAFILTSGLAFRLMRWTGPSPASGPQSQESSTIPRSAQGGGGSGPDANLFSYNAPPTPPLTSVRQHARMCSLFSEEEEEDAGAPPAPCHCPFLEWKKSGNKPWVAGFALRRVEDRGEAPHSGCRPCPYVEAQRNLGFEVDVLDEKTV